MLGLGTQAMQLAIIAVLVMFGSLVLGTLARTIYTDFVANWTTDSPSKVSRKDALVGQSDKDTGTDTKSDPQTEEYGHPPREQRSYDMDFEDIDWLDE